MFSRRELLMGLAGSPLLLPSWEGRRIFIE
jgi:hypothetical protein